MTYSCVAHADNQRSFNDGYHVQHHLNSRLHWSELPARLIETLAQHADADGDWSAVNSSSRSTFAHHSFTCVHVGAITDDFGLESGQRHGATHASEALSVWMSCGVHLQRLTCCNVILQRSCSRVWAGSMWRLPSSRGGTTSS